MPKKMIKKSSSSSSSSSIKNLPVDIQTEIIKKVLDLKTLCLFKSACKRFRDITSQVDTVVYSCKGKVEFEFAMKSLLTFTSLKFLRIVLPSKPDNDLYKWKITFGRSRNLFDSFVVLFFDSKDDDDYQDQNDETGDDSQDENDDGELDWEDVEDRYTIATGCLEDAVRRYKMMLSCIKDEIPLLQMVSITDPYNRGVVTAGEEQISQTRKLGDQCNAETIIQQDPSGYVLHARSLELPVSGHVIKGVYLFFLGSAVDFSKLATDVDIGGSTDEEDMIYNEAIKEMLQNSVDFRDISDSFSGSLYEILHH